MYMNEIIILATKHTIKSKALLRVQYLLTFLWGGGEEQEASALLSKKGGREGSIESQQKWLLYENFFSLVTRKVHFEPLRGFFLANSEESRPWPF